jgi:hypothetical protein
LRRGHVMLIAVWRSPRGAAAAISLKMSLTSWQPANMGNTRAAEKMMRFEAPNQCGLPPWQPCRRRQIDLGKYVTSTNVV